MVTVCANGILKVTNRVENSALLLFTVFKYANLGAYFSKSSFEMTLALVKV